MMSLGIVIAEPVYTDLESEDMVRPIAADSNGSGNDGDLPKMDELSTWEDG